MPTTRKDGYYCTTSDAPRQACRFVDICAEGGYDCAQYRRWVTHPRSTVDTTLERVPDKVSKWL
jgi:hypothetical protein